MTTFCYGEEDLAVAERLLAAERARLAGTCGYSVNDFQNNLLQAIKKGRQGMKGKDIKEYKRVD